MTVGMDAGKVSGEKVTKESQKAGSLRLDRVMIALYTWLIT